MSSRVSRWGGRLLVLGLVLLAAFVVLYVVPSDKYIFLPDKAHPVDPLVEVPASEAAPDRDSGGIYFVDVIVRKATLLEKIWPGYRDGADVVPAHAVVPPGANDRQRRKLDLQEMQRSQEIASAVALRALGRKVDARPTGVVIDAVDPKAPASGELHVAQRIVALDGKPVTTTADLRRLLQLREPGAEVTLTVVDADGRHEVTVKTTSADDRTVIGIIVEQAVAVKLPLDVDIDSGQIGGPSAGLAFALDVMEELGRDVDHGLEVAATGELALDGSVHPVGGLKQKTIGARRTGVDVFLVPAGENAQVARRYADGLRVVPVKSFRQALSTLTTLARKA